MLYYHFINLSEVLLLSFFNLFLVNISIYTPWKHHKTNIFCHFQEIDKWSIDQKRVKLEELAY